MYQSTSVARSVVAMILAALTTAATAQQYPEKPVRIIVPFPPGGANDIGARVVGQKLFELWGRPTVIDNRAGAGGNIGTDIAAKSAPDGYTLVMGSGSTLGANVGLYAKLPFDPRKDFTPITLIASAPYVLVVNNAVAANSVQQLIQMAKAQPQRLNFSSFGEGSSAHLVAEDFKHQAGIEMTHIPYKGGGPALAAVMGGEVQVTFSNLSVALPQVRANKVRALAVTTAKRASALLEVPTVAESGVRNFEGSAWLGLLGPAGLPKPIAAKIHKDMQQILTDPATRKQFADQGLETTPSTPQELAERIRVEIDRYTKVIKQAGIKQQ